ncbi:hypothetical protein [Actinoplanes sp. NPDC026619]|uniref:hypothetical protein n=1 Tax=Actinoplanes sp. NPDC026619 TaxID=3155798 RepID=UPI00340317E4
MNGKMLVAVAVTAALAGCGAQDVHTESGASPPAVESASPETSSSPAVSSSSRPATATTTATGGIPASPRPSGPPKGPTDQIKTTAWVVGTVTADSSGPCYGLETDDGTQYALYAANGPKLTKASRIRIKTGLMKAKMYCGPGRAVEMVSSEPVR